MSKSVSLLLQILRRSRYIDEDSVRVAFVGRQIPDTIRSLERGLTLFVHGGYMYDAVDTKEG